MKYLRLLSLLSIVLFLVHCSKKSSPASPNPGTGGGNNEEEIVYDETGCLYTSYNNLVMAGYQGWFAAEGDESKRGWYHYQNGSCGGFKPGCSAVDF